MAGISLNRRSSSTVGSQNRDSVALDKRSNNNKVRDGTGRRSSSVVGNTSVQQAYNYLNDAAMASMLSGIPFIGEGADAYAQLKSQQASMLYNEGQAQINRNFVTSEREASQMWYEYMWNKNNEYNSLAKQVERAEAAGFSPNAVLGNQSMPQSISTPSGTSAGFATVGDLGSDYANKGLQRKLLEAQADNVKSDTRNKDYNLQWNYKTEDERYNQLVNQNMKMSAETKSILNKIGIDNIDVSIRQGQYRWLSMKSEAELATLWQNLNNLRNQNLEILSRIELNDKQGDYYVSLKELTDEQKNTEVLEQDVLVQEEYLKKMQGDGQYYENELKRVQVDYSNATGIPLGTQQFELDFYLWSTGRQEDYYQSLRMRQNDADAKSTDKKWYNHFLSNNHLNKVRSWIGFNKKNKGDTIKFY